MATIYKWTINEMITYPSYEGYQNYITQIKWKYSAVNDGGIEVYLFGQTNYNTLSSPYVPYDQITEEQVFGWLDSDPNAESYRVILDNRIMEKINPVVRTLPLPWN